MCDLDSNPRSAMWDLESMLLLLFFPEETIEDFLYQVLNCDCWELGHED